MKKSFNVLAVIFLISPFFLIKCSKEKENKISDNSWRVLSIMSSDNQNILNAPSLFEIQFLKDNSVNLKLDVNSCFSTYRISDAESIKIQSFGCTKMCCDDPFADNLIQALIEVTSYKKDKDSLELLSKDRTIRLISIKNK
jgi:heat shock protein HslJ